MTIRITKNFAGIIEAVKLKSGSTKFYKPNYEGVIQAILDWTGGGGGINIIYPPAGFPPTGEDGDMIGYPDEDGNWFIYIWAEGDWQRTSVYTTDVIPNPPGGVFPGSNTRKDITTPDGELLTDQRDINWYLYELALDRVCREEELESNGDTLPITESQYAVVYDPVKDISSIYLHPDTWENVFNEDSKSIWIDGEPYVIVEVITADGAMIVVNVEGEVESTAGETTEFNSCQPMGGGKTMVFYGALPPEKAPEGAIFTHEDSLKQFIHIGDGVWVEQSSCSGDGEVVVEEPWVYIEELAVQRLKNVYLSQGGDDYVTRIKLGTLHYNDEKVSKITQEWEWDENGDGNWVTYDPSTDNNAYAEDLESKGEWYYFYSCEAASGTPPVNPSHPHPCAKVRLKLTNTWVDTGESSQSEWYEVWLGKEADPSQGQTHQPPSVCPGGRSSERKRARNADGTYRADDPSTPDINEAWEQ